MEDGNATLTSSGGFSGVSSQYVSCIVVDGHPILPPVMTEERRAEMRMYKELAVARQKERQQRQHVEDHAPSSIADEEEDLEDGRPVTSTPKKIGTSFSACSSDLENLPESSGTSEDEDEESSATSASTGTFIIRRKQSEDVLSVGEASPLPQEMEEPVSPSAFLYSKRKRPAKYFDTKDEEEVGKTHLQLDGSAEESSFASTTLSKYLTSGGGSGSASFSSLSNKTTPGESSAASKSFVTQFLPNSVPPPSAEEELKSSCSSTDRRSFTINTDFLLLSKLSLEDDKRSPPLKAVRRSVRRKFFDSPEPKTPEEGSESDKENILEDSHQVLSVAGSRGHVRKLSYTLSEPSEALLSAGLRSPPSGGHERSPLSPIAQSAPNTPQGKMDNQQRKEVGEDYKDGSNTSSELGKGEALEKLEILMNRYEEEARRMKALFEAEKVKILQEIGEVKGQQIEDRVMQMEMQEEEEKVLDLSKKSSVDKVPSELLRPSSSSSSVVVLSESTSVRNIFGPSEPQSPSSIKLGSEAHAASAASPRVTSSGLALLQSIRGGKRSSSKSVCLPDATSPLLKGLVIPPETVRSQEEGWKISTTRPGVNIDSVLDRKLCKLSAAVKGYLVRRLLNTERVQGVVATIRDTVAFLLSLYEEKKAEGTESSDDDLNKRLLQQLTSACTSFHDVFFKLSTHERMAIIANDREKLKAKALHFKVSSSSHSGEKKLTEATLKCLERRLTLEKSPSKPKNSGTWRRRTTTSQGPSYSRFVQRQSYAKNANVNDAKVGMKRRRLSTATVLTNRDTNGNNTRRPSTSSGAAMTFDRALPSVTPREYHSARQDSHQPDWGSTTFVIPSSKLTNVTSNTSSRLSSRMSVSTPASTPSSRVPWK